MLKDIIEVEEKKKKTKKTEMVKKDTITNEVVLVGYICKNQYIDKHHLEEEISDILLAVNRAYNKSDYIPCIAWEEMQDFAKT